MRTDRALALLSRENPVDAEALPAPDWAQVTALRERILLEPRPRPTPANRARRVSAAGLAAVVVAAVVAILIVGSPRGGRGIEDAAAAVQNAATVTAEAARRSGTVVVRITDDGELWAGQTIRWHGRDLSLTTDSADREGRVGSQELVVDGILYGIDPEDGAWVNQGGVENIDPDSGTTPYERLAAIREDVGGETLERITSGMTGLTTQELRDGSVVYSGSVAAGLVARETGFKEGESIRVLPFGYVAHDEAENPEALLGAAVTVGADGVVREIAVSWGTWIYRVAYSELGTTPAPKAPANARSILRERGLD
jgi:hypothetical protein